MADVTPKPLRSQGNAVINLMGAIGGMCALILLNLTVVYDETGGTNYFFLFLSVALVMLIAVAVLAATIRERKLVEDMKAINYGVSEAEDQGRTDAVDGKEQLPRDVRRSLIFILACVALWFMGYNAITTAFTKYATTMWHSGFSQASTCLMIATVGAVASYIPIGILSAKLGRRRVIRLGLAIAALSFAFGAVFAREFSFGLYIMFLAVGFAQAAVTVNTFPMVWEISRAGNVGKYTGLYYTCSMSAQIVTPIVSGYLLQWFGYDTLFPYGAAMVLLAMIPISLARHGDNRPQPLKNKLEAFGAGDD
jgi:MFS family permease